MRYLFIYDLIEHMMEELLISYKYIINTIAYKIIEFIELKVIQTCTRNIC